MKEPVTVGGQAVIEGVMMRAPRSLVVAVRTPSGKVEVKREALRLLADRFPIFKKPVLRGVIALGQSLKWGVKALDFSANMAIEEEEKSDSGTLSFLFAMILGIAGALLLFVALPLYLTVLLEKVFPVVDQSSLAFNLVDGVLRVAVFLLYILLISLIKDIRRLFQYHGAEHKSIYAFEAGCELTVENARGFSMLHPRCGTSFMLIVMVLSILVFSLIPHESPFWIKGGLRLALIPLIAGLAYELIKFSAKKRGSRFMEILIAPGLWLQRLTTREPTDDMIEVALIALKEAMSLEKMKEAAS
jgi:uncharacterized protein YqhQ